MINKEKKNRFWNKEAKKPTKLTFILLISFTLVLLIWGIVDTIEDFHEIKVVIDYPYNWYGGIYSQDTYETIDDGESEYIYQIREGNTIYINIYLSERGFPISILIFDNGDLVTNYTEKGSYNPIEVEYTVGE